MTDISNPGAPDGRNNWEHEPANRAVLLREAAQTLRENAEKVRRPYGPEEFYDLAVAHLLDSLAVDHEDLTLDGDTADRALAVARAVLRRES